MAKRDVNKEYLQLQNDYFEALAMVKEFDEEFKKGDLPQSVLDEAQQRLQDLKKNYDMFTYILFLLNKPNRDWKKWREETNNGEWYEYLKKNGVSAESIKDESHDALVDFKKFVKENAKHESK